MTDPLSITAGIVGITVPTLHAIRLLLDDVSQIRNASSTVAQLGSDLAAVERAVQSLQGIEDQEWQNLGELVAEYTRETVEKCRTACESFRRDIQRWTKHSEDDKLSWQDRATVGFFKDGEIKSMAQQLQNCNLTITSTVSIAVLYSTLRHGQTLNSIQGTLQTRQSEVTQATRNTEAQLSAFEEQMRVIRVSAANTEDQTEADETQQRPQAERDALRTSLELLNELLRKLQREELEKAARPQFSSTTVTFGNLNSGFQANNIYGGVSGLTFGQK